MKRKDTYRISLRHERYTLMFGDIIVLNKSVLCSFGVEEGLELLAMKLLLVAAGTIAEKAKAPVWNDLQAILDELGASHPIAPATLSEAWDLVNGREKTKDVDGDEKDDDIPY